MMYGVQAVALLLERPLLPAYMKNVATAVMKGAAVGSVGSAEDPMVTCWKSCTKRCLFTMVR